VSAIAHRERDGCRFACGRGRRWFGLRSGSSSSPSGSSSWLSGSSSSPTPVTSVAHHRARAPWYGQTRIFKETGNAAPVMVLWEVEEPVSEARLSFAQCSGKASDADPLVWSNARLGRSAVPVRSLQDAARLGTGAKSPANIDFTGLDDGSRCGHSAGPDAGSQWSNAHQGDCIAHVPAGRLDLCL